MNEKLFKTAAAEDDINIDKVVKYIHQYIKFNSNNDKVSYQASMDDTFDWIVEKVNKEHEKELSYN